MAHQWRPASGNESFEIVRRRLFEPITTTKAGPTRCGGAFIHRPLAANKADFLPKRESPATETR